MTGGPVDPRIAQLAHASSNFGFLLPRLDLLVLYGATAANAIYLDPNVAMYRARQFGEVMARDLVRRFGLTLTEFQAIGEALELGADELEAVKSPAA